MRFFFFALLLISFDARAADLETLVKVRLSKNLKEISLAGGGLRTGGFGGEAMLRWDRRVIRYDAGLKKWIISDPSTSIHWASSDRILRVTGDGLRTATKEWPSRLLLVPRGGKFDVVAEMNVRDYLTGVVAHEVPRSWPLETLKAQAVAARSYALAVRDARKNSDWHLESTVDDQMFGTIGENQSDVRTVRDAVRGTDGVVLQINKKILKAYYHADCGGHTVAAPTVWPGEPDSGVAVDSSCPASPSATWRAEFALKDIVRKLGGLSLDPSKGPLSLVAFNDKGRVRSLVLGVAGRASETVAAQDFRMRLGSQDVRSTNFDITQHDEIVVLKGRGYGHGVGLCQWGSRALGLKGQTAVAILSHYYPKATLTRLAP